MPASIFRAGEILDMAIRIDRQGPKDAISGRTLGYR
jgi:hypothetical protein